jgi:uncharacterized protein (TIGR03437 family)
MGAGAALLLSATLAGALVAATAPSYLIETVAGAGEEGGPATDVALGGLEGLAVDRAGKIYLADAAANRVWKLDLGSRTLEPFAGTGVAGFSGDGGPAREARLNRPYDVAVDARGNLYIADFGNGRVRRVAPDGRIETVAGGGSSAPADGLAARNARLGGPRNLTVDSAGAVYFSDFLEHRVWALTPSGALFLLAGVGIAGYAGDGTAGQTLLNGPAGLALDRTGGLYIADSGNGRVRRLLGGRIETVLEGVPWPVSVAIDSAGVLYVASAGARAVLRLPPDGRAAPLAAEIPLEDLRAVASGPDGALYVADRRRLWLVSSRGEVRRLAGMDAVDPGTVLATRTRLFGPIGVALDDAGDLLIAEEGRKAIRKLDAAGLLAAVAAAGLWDPVAVVPAGAGDLFVADYLGHRVVKVTARGTVVPVAGTGEAGFSGDGGPALGARLDRPRGLALDGRGNLYVADSGNHRVRMITPAGDITTLAGTGSAGGQGDGGPARQAQLDTPTGLAVDAEGNLYVAERGGHRIRRIDPAGRISTMAGTGRPGYGGDGGAAREAWLDSPAGVAVDRDGNLYIADTGNHRVRYVTREGRIRTIAGDGTAGFAGDGGPAHLARLNSPAAVAVDPQGRIYVADLDNGRIRRLTPLVAPPALEDVTECIVVHAATLKPGPAAPGQLVTLFGRGFGPEVRIGGTPAPVFYQDDGQINTRLASGIESGSTLEVEVRGDGRLRARCRLSVVAAAPGIFTLARGAGQAAAVNEDGTLNSPEQPARQGSVLTFYATGEGRTTDEPLPKPLLPVDVRVAGLPVEIEYAGQAPGYPGLMQINIRLPSGLVPTGVLPLELIVGGISSQPGVTIAMR